MESSPHASEPTAEDHFADFLERLEAGESVDFESLCERVPDLAVHLRRIHARWQAMATAFSTLMRDAVDCDERSHASSPALTNLLEALGKDPSRWHRYAVGDEIARGSMGRILSAWDPVLHRQVALKVQREDRDDGRVLRRFVEEAQIAAQLDHPGIVPIHELGADPQGRPFFSMRLVDGRTLAEIFEQVHAGDGDWSRTRVLHLLVRVCEALAYAHHKGVVHRDLKPANVMVGRFGETYVMDWGLAGTVDSIGHDQTPQTVRREIANDDADSALLSRDGDVLGTPAYMAPEQAAGQPSRTDPLVDVYAMGAMLHHLLAGVPPYGRSADRSASAALKALRLGPPEPIATSVPAELRAICERAMAREPSARYPGIAALADDMRAYLELRVVSAYASGSVAELRKWVARNRALACSSLAFVIAVILGGLYMTQLWLVADDARARADATAVHLRTELDRSDFRNARLALRSDDASSAGGVLWQHHLSGRMPRSTRWALAELAERHPVLATRAMSGLVDMTLSVPENRMVVSDRSGALEAFDGLSLQPRWRLPASLHRYSRIDAARNAGWLVAGTTDGNVAIIDAGTGVVLRSEAAHDDAIAEVCVARDGSFASADSRGVVRYWQHASAQPRSIGVLGEPITELTFDPDCRVVAIGTESGQVVTIGIDGAPHLSLRIDDFQIMTMSFASDGRQLWVGTRNIHVIDLATGTVRETFATRNGTCRALLHDAQDNVYAGGWWRIDRLNTDRTAPQTAALIGTWAMALDRPAQRLATMRRDHGLDIIDIGERDLRRVKAGSSTALATDGRSLLQIDSAALWRMDIASSTVTDRVGAQSSGWLASNHDGSLVAVIGRGKNGVRLIDVASGATRHELDGASEIPFHDGVVFAPTGQEIAVVLGSDRVRRHRVDTAEPLAEYALPGQRVMRLGYSGDGRHLGVLSRDSRAVRIFALAGGAHEDIGFPASPGDAEPSHLSAFALDRTATRVAAGTWTGQLFVHDRTTGITRRLQSHTGATWSLVFDPSDPGLLMSSVGAGGITFWDLDANEVCYQSSRLPTPLSQLQVSGDGQTLAAQSPEGTILVDLAYRQRHVAARLLGELARPRLSASAPPERAAALQGWATEVMRQPWPRWR